MKIRSCLADKDRDSVFELFPLLLEKNGLRARSVEKSLFLRNIETGSNAAFVTRIDKLKAFLQSVNCAAEDANFGVELAQREVVGSQFGSDKEANTFQIGSACLIRSLRGFDAAPTAAKEIDLVIYGEWNAIAVLRNGSGDWDQAIGGTVARKPLALGRRCSRKRGKKRGYLHGGAGSGLLQ